MLPELQKWGFFVVFLFRFLKVVGCNHAMWPKCSFPFLNHSRQFKVELLMIWSLAASVKCPAHTLVLDQVRVGVWVS